jgi:hypothetical protein
MSDDRRLHEEVLRLAVAQAEARGAIAMIRAAVESVAPGAMRPHEELDASIVAEALEIIRAIRAIAGQRPLIH